MNDIEKYYNKFNEDKRLLSRHGKVEFFTTMEYIKNYLHKGAKIIDIGAGTGKYSIELYNMGYDVTAVELVKKNLSVLKQNCPSIPAMQANALNLKKIKDNTYDITLLLGPMYHLFTKEDKLRALTEAKRVTKPNGVIFVAYILADYAIIRHAIMDGNLDKSLSQNKIDDNYNIISSEKDLYSYVRLPEIDQYNLGAGLYRKIIFSPDGPTDYIRPYVNKLSESDFEYYKRYVLHNSANSLLLGASSHVVDILIKPDNQ